MTLSPSRPHARRASIALGLLLALFLPAAAGAQSGPEIMQKHRELHRVKESVGNMNDLPAAVAPSLGPITTRQRDITCRSRTLEPVGTAESGDEDGRYVIREYHWQEPYLDGVSLAGDLEPIGARMRLLMVSVMDEDLDPELSFLSVIDELDGEIGDTHEA